MSEQKPALPDQQPKPRSDAKPDYKALKPSRRIYNLLPDGEIELFWLNADNSRTPIKPWESFPNTAAFVAALRKIGYITLEELENK